MKKIVFGAILTIAVCLSSSCAKEMDAPCAIPISGKWANGVWADRYIVFEAGKMSECFFDEARYVCDSTIWNLKTLDIEKFKFTSVAYSIIDGELISKTLNGKVSVKDSVMMIGDQKYFLITGFSMEQYSKILPSSENLVKYTYAVQSVEWNYSIENPVEGQDLTIVAKPDWVTDVVVTDSKIAFNVPESKEDKQGKFILHYDTADDVEISVTQTAARSINVNKAFSWGYAASDCSIPYTIENPEDSFVMEATVDKDWISDVKVNEGNVSFKVSENNTKSSRTATLKLSYPEAKDVEVVITQTYSAVGISTSPSSGSCNYVGGDFEFTYTVANPREGESLTAKSTTDWITGVTISGNKVTYKVAVNNSGSSRTGKITLSYAGESKTFSVNQSCPSIILSSTEVSTDYTSKTLSFDYTIENAVSGVTLSATSDVDWITGVAVSGNKVTYKVAVNNSGSSRTGKITLTYAGVSKTFSITQQRRPIVLSSSESANCYVVSSSEVYMFSAVKGNSSASVGSVSYAAVLWESFGTSTAPSKGDLVKNVTYSDGYIAFEATDKKGNAVIAAKDASGKILWSWHIWLTDQPEGQVYNNNAGTMMDRNLGATSATPGDVGALGLLYQWGRKDPFLGSSSIDDEVEAKSTLTWPSEVSSTSSRGTVAYVTANPTTYVYCSSSSNAFDWHYGSRDNTLWQSSKTIYDPCPPGWRVPDGGSNGVWSKASGSSSKFSYTYSSSKEGMNFSGKFGTASTIWYPASGYRDILDGGLISVGYGGGYWSVTSTSFLAYYLYFNNYGSVYPSDYYHRALGSAVRCLQESK